MNERTGGGCAVRGPDSLTCVLCVPLRRIPVPQHHSEAPVTCRVLRGQRSVHLRNMTTCITAVAWICAYTRACIHVRVTVR